MTAKDLLENLRKVPVDAESLKELAKNASESALEGISVLYSEILETAAERMVWVRDIECGVPLAIILFACGAEYTKEVFDRRERHQK